MKRLLLGVLGNLPFLIVFGLAVAAWLTGDAEVARYFVVLAVLLGISKQIGDLRDELRERDQERTP